VVGLPQGVPDDSVRAVLREVFSAPEYAWDTRAHPLQFFIDQYRRFVSWLNGLADAHPVAYWTILALLTGLLLAILVHLGWLVWRALRPRAGAHTIPATGRVVVHDAGWHMREAARLARDGRYAEAIGHRFLALVLELDRRNVVRFDPSKTPAEYAAEARLAAPAATVLADVVSRLYRHLFAGAACSADDLVAFDDRANAVIAAGAWT